jgi:anti-sigma factor (TIGR02949 family)
MTANDCRDHTRMLGSYLDGEIGAAKLLEIDEHVAGCETCREETQLLRAMRGSLKRVVRSAAPTSLRDRIGNAMSAQRERAEHEAEEAAATVPASALPTWRTLVPLATAAALAIVWGAAARGTQPTATRVRADLGGADLLAELVSEHQDPLPLDAHNAGEVRGLARYVGVPVSPGRFERAGAHLVGGRVVSILPSQRAAMIEYVVGTGHDERRLSVMVYDAQKIPEVGMANLAPRAVGTAEVRVGREKGYSVTATQRAGVGYLIASDLDPDQSAQLAAMLYDDR